MSNATTTPRAPLVVDAERRPGYAGPVDNPRIVAGLAAVAAIAPLFFSFVYFVVLPARGLDLDRFGDPTHVLEVCAENPFVFRVICVNNAVLLICSALVAGSLPRHLRAPFEWTSLSARLTTSGWLLYLVGEMPDFAAYLSVPSAHRAGIAEAGAAFFTLQHLGRITHMFAYLLMGLGLLGLTAAMRGVTPRWPQALIVLGFVVGANNLALFAIDCFSTTLSGDAGAGGIFNLLLGADTLLLAVWHGALGTVLWRRA